MQLGRDRFQGQLGVNFQPRLEIGQRQARASVGVQMIAQFGNICAGKREADRMRVPTVAGKQLAARLERIQQVE